MVKNSAAEVQVFAGIDVSARELSVAVHSRTVDREQAQTFSNNASGHHALRAHLLRGKGHVRVSLEASGNYSLVRSSLDFARPPPGGSQCSEPSSRAAFRGIPWGAQQDRSGRCPCALPIRLPHALASFGATQQAGLALAWPDTSHRSTGCYSDTGEESSALVAGQQGSIYIPIRELQRHLDYLQVRITRLRREALRLIARDPELDRRFRLMLTTPGIGETSALQILGELAVLPDTLDARQWFAFAGLDPLRFTSGTTVDKKPRISRGGSRHLRRALYMPALVAIRHEPHLRAFFQRLVARGKAPLQAVVAVMRKLLHAFFAMFRSDHSYDRFKLCPVESVSDPGALCAA